MLKVVKCNLFFYDDDTCLIHDTYMFVHDDTRIRVVQTNTRLGIWGGITILRWG